MSEKTKEILGNIAIGLVAIPIILSGFLMGCSIVKYIFLELIK